MNESLEEIIADLGHIPLCWVGRNKASNYLNLGDALSPVMVSMISGMAVRYVGARSQETRLAAVGTIGQMFEGGDVTFWGTGTSPHFNPLDRPEDKRLYHRPANTKVTIRATRGPYSRRVLADGDPAPEVYGDPLWLLPRFHDAPRKKTHELGVILHLSELEERSYDTRPKTDYHRYELSADDASSVRLINTVTPTSIAALRERLDEILSCKRIVSTSLHGMVFAESYGIPCLYFSPNSHEAGLDRIDLLSEQGIDLRFNDLYRGLGQTRLDIWMQPRAKRTDWGRVMDTIDRMWFPKSLDEDKLIEAFPGPIKLIGKGVTGSAFDHPLIRKTPIGKPGAISQFVHKLRGVGRRSARG